MKTQVIHSIIDQFFRHEAGKMNAVLVKLLGFDNWETANDIVQDTLLQAMNTWAFKGIPDNPSAWLYKVARNKAIDLLRREKKFQEIRPQYAYLLQSEYSLSGTVNHSFLEEEISDSVLKMMFACSHASIPEESQVALILKTLCGLNVSEIARAFLTSDETIAKRIYRAKEKIKIEKIELDLPEPDQLSSRTDSVLKSIYLLFNEGYNSSHPDQLIRKDLCEEAIRLCYLLTHHNRTRFPRTYALLALMHFQASRLDARIDKNGGIVLLKDQDRNKWNQKLIRTGFDLLEHAAEPFETSTYHFEAAIASIHASAKTLAQTDWKSIFHLYEMLYNYHPNPIIAMNKAIASGYAFEKERALEEMQAIKGLETYYLYNASFGEILLSLNRKAEAREKFMQAMRYTQSLSERQFLLQKISDC